jgi:hypothetical protein
MKALAVDEAIVSAKRTIASSHHRRTLLNERGEIRRQNL